MGPEEDSVPETVLEVKCRRRKGGVKTNASARKKRRAELRAVEVVETSDGRKTRGQGKTVVTPGPTECRLKGQVDEIASCCCWKTVAMGKPWSPLVPLSAGSKDKSNGINVGVRPDFTPASVPKEEYQEVSTSAKVVKVVKKSDEERDSAAPPLRTLDRLNKTEGAKLQAKSVLPHFTHLHQNQSSSRPGSVAWTRDNGVLSPIPGCSKFCMYNHHNIITHSKLFCSTNSSHRHRKVITKSQQSQQRHHKVITGLQENITKSSHNHHKVMTKS